MADTRIEEIRQLLPQTMLADWVRIGSRLVRLLRDQLHPARHDAVLTRLLEQSRRSVALRVQRKERIPLPSYPPELPITTWRDEIIATLRTHQVLVIAGETGSGKTTQIPKMCLEAGFGIEAQIGCTQPRRVAALSISRRVAEELNVSWSHEVGCKIRFDDRSSDETYIKFMTDGILLAETQGDPLLTNYNALIIDEAHERSLNIDFLLGYLKGLLAKRPELRLVITSATIDTKGFSQAFGNCPVIEVSGRVYPVDVIYSPLDSASEESGDITYIEAAANAAQQTLTEPGGGDALIFMPGERDIRETADLLKNSVEGRAEIIPLYGRLSSGDQQRVFAPAARRKIVIATNIAETSLTIPGIRYVIDSGLARISRYNPRTRTRRLPIEPVSQSSANQRKGRAGRLRKGLCIRLYSEEDFMARPPHTQPEIQRANLAEVILRMKAFRLGEIESFPFLNPPAPAAIQAGYSLLQELGALDTSRDLTPLGRDLARLPIDPTLGRMLIQAHQEHATSELLIIAAGLSIQDPRERPAEQKETANTAHKRFNHPDSDFLTLLNIWNVVHEQWEKLPTQNQRRKFCRANFLSYLRMREWQDLHAQLRDALEELGTLRLNESNAAYEAVHRSILAGLLGHVAQRKERNIYQAAGNRLVNVFPGSSLYYRAEAKQRKHPREEKADPKDQVAGKSRQPEWIVAGEMVETSQVFARTLAGIDPLWVVALAPHLCRVTYENPAWDVHAGRVLATEKTTLYGLEIRKRKVAYGNIAPKAATAVFIRSALVEGNLFPDDKDETPGSPNRRDRSGKDRHSQLNPPSNTGHPRQPRYPFLEHNESVRHKIETLRTRTRRHDLPDLDEALVSFYSRHLENVSSFDELNRYLRGCDPAQLHVSENDLIGDLALEYDEAAFPDRVSLEGHEVPVSYSYAPGEDTDGVTLKLPSSLARDVSPAAVEWAVPGLRESQVSELLRALPKALRKQLMPFLPKVTEISRELRPSSKTLAEDLSRFVFRRYGIEVPPSSWSMEAVPMHLRPRVEIVTDPKKPALAGRDFNTLRNQLENAKIVAPDPLPAWRKAAAVWERFGLTSWNFGDLPEQVNVSEGPPTVEAWPGLQVEDGHVGIRLFHTLQAANRATVPGFQRLLELSLQKDLAWLHKDLRALSRLNPLYSGVYAPEELHNSAFANLRRHLLRVRIVSLREAVFRQALEQAVAQVPGLALTMVERLEPILKLRQEIARRIGPPLSPAPARKPLSSLQDLDLSKAVAQPAGARSLAQAELDSLLPRNFFETVSFDRFIHLPRYLKALLIRLERATLNPLKDQERARLVLPYAAAVNELRARKVEDLRTAAAIEDIRWAVEEYRVSVFAQEIGTAFPVSPKRLDEQLRQVRALVL